MNIKKFLSMLTLLSLVALFVMACSPADDTDIVDDENNVIEEDTGNTDVEEDEPVESTPDTEDNGTETTPGTEDEEDTNSGV